MKKIFAMLLAMLLAASGAAEKQTEPTSTSAPTEETSTSALTEESSSTVADDSSDDATDDPSSTSADEAAVEAEDNSSDNAADDSSSPVATVEMPNVLGMHYKDATTLLEETLTDVGFTDVCVALGWAWGNGDPNKTFTIIGQEPEAGTILDVNSASITVVIYAQEYGIE
ncbi:MAG: PASTA domain-containing protein [Clostridiales bacterium]|nr:PASTA domain-containing protein [Clostridiales bacterium]